MFTRIKLVVLSAIVASAALLPLYGDPRNAALTHPEWARMLLRALHLDAALPQAATASQAFAILSWKGSLSFRADRYAKGDDVEVEGTGEGRQVVAKAGVGEVTYPLAVVRAGDYRVRLQIAGDPQHPASAEVARLGEVKATGAFTVVPAAMMSWVDAGATHLDPGAYTTTVLLPAGTTLQHIEVAPPCLSSVEPLGGWKPTAILDTGDAAVTMVRALDAEPALPAADAPIEVDSSMFRSESGMMAAAADGLQGLWLKAGPGGLRAIVLVTIPEPGLYTISAYGVLAAGQSWTADACRKSVLCAAKDLHAGDGPQWRPVLTSDFSAGPHVLSVVLGPGAGIERVRAERKKNAVEGYVSVLRSLGFDVGAPGPMPRDRANEAMRFLEKRITPLQESGCGDIVLPNLTVRAGLEVAQIPGPAQAPPGAGTGQPPLGGPLVPPSAGPTPSPLPSTPVTPSAPPASPPPPSTPPSSPPTPGPSPVATPLPPPPTLPSPSPASPVQPLRGSPAP